MTDPSASAEAQEPMTAPKKERINVAPAERLASIVGGGLITIYGLARGLGSRSPVGLIAAAAGGALFYRGVTGYCPAYQAAGINTPGRTGPISIKETFTICRSRRELYDTCRNLENLPRFTQYLKSVQLLDERRSQWQAKLPGLGTLVWIAEITEERPEELLSWHSLPGSDLEEVGSIRFTEAPGKRGTEMHIEIDYWPPAGTPGAIAASLVNPMVSQAFREEMRRFKNLVETGEIPTITGQPAGR